MLLRVSVSSLSYQILLYHVFQCPLMGKNATDAEAVLKAIRYGKRVHEG